MSAITTLRNEHKYILRMLKVVKDLSIHTFNTKEVYYEGYHNAIDFIRNYADKFHHGKEEDILFVKMGEELGERVKQGPIFGMLMEHDLGRLFTGNLENALFEVEKGNKNARVDVIANAVAYTDLLYRHIDKEDNALFNFAEQNLSDEAKKTLQTDFEKASIDLNADEVEKKYIGMLEDMESYVASL